MMIFRSKQILLVWLLVLALATPAFAQESAPAAAPEAPKADISTKQLELAKQYLALDPIEDEIKRGVAQTAEGIEADQRVLFRSMADKHINFTRVRTTAEIAAAQTFTEDELKALIKFFGTEEGKSIRLKMPAYHKQIQPTIMEELKMFIEKIQSVDILQNQ
ncbi:MAG: DUF2059 domain-containing protein [Proteobacteria bacterium]|nr:DUF2059 domain-containing protein [Pseudomonadota bacterium]